MSVVNEDIIPEKVTFVEMTKEELIEYYKQKIEELSK